MGSCLTYHSSLGLCPVGLGTDGAAKDLEVPFSAKAEVTSWSKINNQCLVYISICSRNTIKSEGEAAT